MTKSWADVNALYQIYPRSFMDANGDGVGDIRGIIERLDYIKALGVDAIWLSPVYLSPQDDNGYDIADYRVIDPLFGTNDDVRTLIAAAHEHGLKVMMDFVPNHTSDQHPWFAAARLSRDNPYRDYYVWRDQPNNWVSLAGGSAWTYDEQTGQYYLHSFMSSQPDLNWDNPRVRDEMKQILRYWFDQGIDGFRVDAVWPLSKDPEYSDDAINDSSLPETDFGHYIHDKCRNGARLHEYLREMTEVVASFDDRYMLFEYYPDDKLGDPLTQIIDLHAVAPRVAAPFYFEGVHAPWSAEYWGESLTRYFDALPPDARSTICLGNHDQSRLVTRYGREQARLLAVLQMTLPGIPCVYYGEELGMNDVTASEVNDKFVGVMGGRDPERTPMQWGDERGFSTGTPWLPLAPDAQDVNVVTEQADPHSFLHLYKELLHLYRDTVIRDGAWRRLDSDSGYVLIYERTLDGRRIVVALNFADAEQTISVHGATMVILSTHEMIPVITQDRVTLRGFEAVVLS